MAKTLGFAPPETAAGIGKWAGTSDGIVPGRRWALV